jgi:glycosyltransferase involved in cell wall biosynthesis
MKVSLINLTLVAGDAIGECMLNQARLFLRRGDDVRFYVCHPPEGVPQDLAARASVVSLADLLRGEQAHFRQSDLYIYHYPSRHPLMESIKGIERGAVVFYYHNVTPPELWGAEVDRAALVRGQEGIALAHYADLVITPSVFNADDLVERGGLDRARVRVLPLAVPLDRFSPGPKDIGLVRQYGLEGQRVLLFVGRMAGNKRIDLLVEALALIKARIPNVKLLLVGDSDGSPAYRDVVDRARAQAAELGVGDDVILTGRVDPLPPYYRLADVYVTASLHEGFGVPLIEAMASGVPVVAARAGAMPWVIGEAGRLCEPGDARGLAEQALELLQNDALHGDLAQRGLARARDFSLECYEAGLLGIVDEITQPWALGNARPAALAPAGPPHVHGSRSEVALAAEVEGLALECDVALRGYVVHSSAPLVGPFIAWARRNLTSHLREPYLDRIVERQVQFNRQAAELLARVNDVWTAALRQQGQQLSQRLEVLEARTYQAALADGRLRLMQARLELLAAQVAVLEAERDGQADAPRLESVRQQIAALRASLEAGKKDLP